MIQGVIWLAFGLFLAWEIMFGLDEDHNVRSLSRMPLVVAVPALVASIAIAAVSLTHVAIHHHWVPRLLQLKVL